MNRIGFLFYGIICYGYCLFAFAYGIGFLGDFFVPKAINSGTPPGTMGALLTDLLLLSAFMLQTYVMALPTVKSWLREYLPRSYEQTTYWLFASGLMILLFRYWQPLDATLWKVEESFPLNGLQMLNAVGWAIVIISILSFQHFDRFGLRQVWLNFLGMAYSEPSFPTTGIFRYVRQPHVIGAIIVLWATPWLTVGHLLFAGLMTAHMFLMMSLEERYRIHQYGRQYAVYQKQVPLMFPRFAIDRKNDSGKLVEVN